jgi:hypothetical protein
MPLLQKRIHFWLVGALGGLLLRLLSATWRVTIIDADGAAASARDGSGQGIFAFWHRHLLTLLCRFRGYRIAVPVSEHRDGEFVAHVMERYGYLAVRGSTTRGSMRMLRGLLDAFADRWSCAITPDGPRGPRFTVHAGFILLARRSGLPVRPVGIAVDRAWVFNSWDAFVVPRPGTRIAIVLGPPITPDHLAGGDVDALRAEMHDALMEATSRAEQVLSTEC